MVAIKAQQATAFAKAVDKSVVAVLVFGDDVGMVAERAKQAADSFAARSDPPGEILRIEDSDLDSDPERLHTELRTVSMFGGARVVRTATSRRVNTQFLKPLLEPGAMAGMLVVETGGLRADEPLRKLFEGSAIAAAVPCYADEARDIEAIVREALAAAGIQMTPEARQLLISRLGADRALTRGEIDKLLLYAHGCTSIGVEDVEAVVGDAAELAIESILMAASGGNGRKAITELDRWVASGESAQGLLVLLLRHFQRLHRLRAALDQGRSFEDAARMIRPPLHFKSRAAIEAHTRAWDAARLDRALAAISRTARDSRLSNQLEATLAERLLLELAAMAGGPRR